MPPQHNRSRGRSYEEHVEEFHNIKMATMMEEHNKKVANTRDWHEKVQNMHENSLNKTMGSFFESEV